MQDPHISFKLNPFIQNKNHELCISYEIYECKEVCAKYHQILDISSKQHNLCHPIDLENQKQSMSIFSDDFCKNVAKDLLSVHMSNHK